MHHVFGLIVKEFSFTDEISRQMKGDYLMMANTWREIDNRGDTCIFYLVTMNTDIAMKLNMLGREFRHKGFLQMKFMTPDNMDYQPWFKKNNIRVQDVGGILVTESNKKMSDDDRRRMATSVGKRCLKRQLGYREEGLTEVKNKLLVPGIMDWDYYGTRED